MVSNWLSRLVKTATPIRIHPKMEEFANKVMLAIEEFGDTPGEHNKQSIKYNEVFLSEPIEIEGKPVVWVSVMFVPPNKPGVLADAETPTWRKDKSGSGECFVRIYDTLPPRNFWGDIKRAVLHELVHCFDPKLNKPDLFDTKWHKEHRKNMTNPEYMTSREYFTAPWEQDAYMSSDAYSQIEGWKRNGVPYIRVVKELQSRTPDSNAEKQYAKDPQLWKRYLRSLWHAFEQIYKNDIPKNHQQRNQLEEEWNSPYSV